MSSALELGSELGGYRLESLLGRGGMGAVYLAEHLRLGRKVALKVLVPELAGDESYRERFVRESRMVATLDHPNVIPIYDADEEEGVLYIAMRYVEGADLKALLERKGRLEPARTLGILEQAASALEAAHERGLVHRDVKPANILIAEPGERVFLTDFGIAKQGPGGLTRAGLFVGTVDYAAPEQIEGRAVSPRTDVYALGCVLYQCLSGSPPFAKETDLAVFHAHLSAPPPSLTETRPELPAAMDAVIATALAKAPEDRYATCTGLVDAARSALRPAAATAAAPRPSAATTVAATAEQQTKSTAPTAPTATAARPRRSGLLLPGLLALAAVALAAAAFAVIALLSQEGDGGSPAAEVAAVLEPLARADSELSASLAALDAGSEGSVGAVAQAASAVAEAATRAQGGAAVVAFEEDQAQVRLLLGRALDANLEHARRVGEAVARRDEASATAAAGSEADAREAFRALADEVPGLRTPSLTGAARLMDLAARGEDDALRANRAYVGSIDRLLTNSAETRMDLGELIDDVMAGSLSFSDARGRIDAIIAQRQSLQNAVAAAPTPSDFERASELLRRSITAALADDFAIQRWINAHYEGDPAAAERFAEHRRASDRATAAKKAFVAEYDRLRARLLDLPPLAVGTSY